MTNAFRTKRSIASFGGIVWYQIFKACKKIKKIYQKVVRHILLKVHGTIALKFFPVRLNGEIECCGYNHMS